LASLSANFVLSVSISFVGAVGAALLPAVRADGLAELLGTDAADSLFFTSEAVEAEAEEGAFDIARRVPALLVLGTSLEAVLLVAVDVLLAALGLVKVLEDVGLRTVLVDEDAPRFSARVSVFTGGL
jgi:hypothetical protein